MENTTMLPTITTECSEFLVESNGNYLIKNLPKTYQGLSKVKVRKSKKQTKFSQNFNKAFDDTQHFLHQRAIFVYTDYCLLPESLDAEPFFIFPIDGYEFIYNPQVVNATNDYGKIDIDGDSISDLLQMSYQTGKLHDVMQLKCEIIFYNIPYYYALRSSIIDNYNVFFNNLENSVW